MTIKTLSQSFTLPDKRIYWKPQHEVFIRGMLAHGNKIKAYREAYPGISPTAIRQAACRLLTYPHIRQRIDTVMAAASETAIRELEEKVGERISEQLMTVYEQRKFLAAIVRGRIKLRRAIKLKDRVVEVNADLDPNIVLRAIELDTKLDTAYPWRTDQEVIDRGINRLAQYLNFLPAEASAKAGNNQGVGICKQIETDCLSPAVALTKVENNQGVSLCKQVETNWSSNPLQEHFMLQQ